MSSSSTSQQPEDSREFELMREIYLQGAPVWPTQDWVTAEMANYASADTRRFSRNWRRFYAKTTRKAQMLREKIVSEHQKKVLATGREPIRLYLQPLSPYLLHLIREQLNQDLPRGWDPSELESEVIKGLDFIGQIPSTKEEERKFLTIKERNAFHLGGVIMGRREAAKILGVTPECVNTHVFHVYRKVEEAGYDADQLRWVLSGRLGKPKKP